MFVYVLVLRRRQWKLFAVPVVAMLALAAPWNLSVFRKAPPFLPGSNGSSTSWMWQSASVRRMLDFVWSSAPYSLRESFESAGTVSLAGLLGPFLLSGVLLFLGWYSGGFTRGSWAAGKTPTDRARIFALVWLAAMLAGTSALPNINYFYQIRYGILTLLPASLLLAWVFGVFAESVRRVPRWAVAAAFALLLAQGAVNFSRSMHHRRELSGIVVAVDRAYEYVNATFPDQELALMPGFLSYSYRLDAASVIKKRDALARIEDLPRHTPGRTLVLSWQPSSSAQLEPLRQFTGCKEGVLFDRVMPCSPGSGIFLTRYVASPQPSLQISPQIGSEAQKYLDLSFGAWQSGQHLECIALARKALR